MAAMAKLTITIEAETSDETPAAEFGWLLTLLRFGLNCRSNWKGKIRRIAFDRTPQEVVVPAWESRVNDVRPTGSSLTSPTFVRESASGAGELERTSPTTSEV